MATLGDDSFPTIYYTSTTFNASIATHPHTNTHVWQEEEIIFRLEENDQRLEADEMLVPPRMGEIFERVQRCTVENCNARLHDIVVAFAPNARSSGRPVWRKVATLENGGRCIGAPVPVDLPAQAPGGAPVGAPAVAPPAAPAAPPAPAAPAAPPAPASPAAPPAPLVGGSPQLRRAPRLHHGRIAARANAHPFNRPRAVPARRAL